MKCPFVDRDCIQRDCIGWANGMCFVENFLKKLDILCHLMTTSSIGPAGQKIDVDPIDTTAAEHIPEEVVAVAEEKTEEGVTLGAWDPIDTPESYGEAVLAIDFGTAFSKIAIRANPQAPALPAPLARTSGDILHRAGVEFTAGDHDFIEPSLLYVDDQNRVLCGTLARDQYLRAAVAGETRPAIRNLKQLLIGGGSKVPIPKEFFPSVETLDIQAILATYLAYLFYLTRVTIGQELNLNIDIGTTIRNFSIPVWDNQDYREEVKAIVRGAITRAYCLEHWLKEELVLGVPLPRLREVLKEAAQYEQEVLGAIRTEITEPVAAGHNRILDLKVTAGNPVQLFIIDIGAGSTDFALLTISQPRDLSEGLKIHTSKQGGVAKGVEVWDNALRALLYSQVMEKAGVTRGQLQFQIFKARLEGELSSHKEKIITSPEGISIPVTPVLNNPIIVSRTDLQESDAVKDALAAIHEGFSKYLKECRQTLTKEKFDPNTTEFIITGGGSFIPSIVECVKDCARILGPTYVNTVKENYRPRLYQTFTDVYPMLAVSLGSTEKEYFEEQMIRPIGPDPGPHMIGGYYTKGI